MSDPEAHFGAERSRQQFARDLGSVDRLRRIEAIVAIAAGFRRFLAEMAKQDGAAASRRLDQRRQRVEPLALAGAAPGLDFLLDAQAGAGEILSRPEQPRLGRLAVASGTPGLLVISLDAFGDRGVGDDPHVGFVDAHSERDRGGDHHLFGVDERRLIAGTHLRLQARMIGS